MKANLTPYSDRGIPCWARTKCACRRVNHCKGLNKPKLLLQQPRYQIMMVNIILQIFYVYDCSEQDHHGKWSKKRLLHGNKTKKHIMVNRAPPLTFPTDMQAMQRSPQ